MSENSNNNHVTKRHITQLNKLDNTDPQTQPVKYDFMFF